MKKNMISHIIKYNCKICNTIPNINLSINLQHLNTIEHKRKTLIYQIRTKCKKSKIKKMEMNKSFFDKITNEKIIKIKKIIKYIDLCHGIGGFRIAINNFSKNNKFKFKCVYSADIKNDAIKTYNINFNEKNSKKNIYNINPNDIPKYDVLCAGFSCQPFSSAGNKNGFNDKIVGIIFM